MTEKDSALIDYLVKNTEAGRLQWEPTAEQNQVLVTLRGKYTATAIYNPNGPNKLVLRDNNGEVVLRLNAQDDDRIEHLYDIALRNARDVDNIIDDILGGENDSATGGQNNKPTDEDTPF